MATPKEPATPEQKRRRLLLAVVGVVVLLFGIRLLLDAFKSEEDRILETLGAIAEAVDDKHPRHFMENISESYKDPQGTSADELRRLISGYLIAPGRGDFTCLIVPETPVLGADGKTATVTLRAAVYEGLTLNVAAPPAGGQAFEMDVQLRSEDGTWRVTSHTRRRFPAQDVWRLYFGE